ncbi:TetR family transcriptional regulator [Lacisediminihabitans sp. FW035]
MGRWEPDARGRLRLSALELYAERGFELTTAAEIAERAGVTERTFFRHFADKREVLFAGSSELQESVVNAVDSAAGSLTPIEIVATAMQTAAALLPDRDYSRRRAQVIAANPSLQERELLKFSTLAGAVADALGRRGIPRVTAGLAAETGVTVFKIGFEMWIEVGTTADFPQCIRDALEQLRGLTSGT